MNVKIFAHEPYATCSQCRRKEKIRRALIVRQRQYLLCVACADNLAEELCPRIVAERKDALDVADRLAMSEYTIANKIATWIEHVDPESRLGIAIRNFAWWGIK